jgi:hypothetical protein
MPFAQDSSYARMMPSRASFGSSRLSGNVWAHCFSFGVLDHEASTEGLGGLTLTVGKCGFESRRLRLPEVAGAKGCLPQHGA